MWLLHMSPCRNQRRSKSPSERKYSNAKQHYNKINRFNICIMLNFGEYIYEKTVNDLVKNCADIDLLSVIEKGKNYHCHSHNKRRCADWHTCHIRQPLPQYRSVAPPKPAPIASVIPYADIIDPITISSVFVAYFLNFIWSPTKNKTVNSAVVFRNSKIYSLHQPRQLYFFDYTPELLWSQRL